MFNKDTIIRGDIRRVPNRHRKEGDPAFLWIAPLRVVCEDGDVVETGIALTDEEAKRAIYRYFDNPEDHLEVTKGLIDKIKDVFK